MYKVIIFGTGVSSQRVVDSLNDNCIVVAFLDNDCKKWSESEAIPIIPPIKLKNMKYDYIIIASQYNDEIYEQLIKLKVERNKILQLYKLVDYEINYISNAINKFLESKEKFEAIATGISYCNLGLKEDVFKKKCMKLTFGSQDLYYDYHLIKYFLDNYKEKMNTIKTIIIGLSYYSFQYDLSLSAMKNKVMLYYNAIGLCHNNYAIENLNVEREININIANNIFTKNEKGEYIIKRKKVTIENNSIKAKDGYNQAIKDCNKNYPETVKENKIIFEKYINLLLTNNIKPVVVVFPAHISYTENFSKRIESEFKEIINEFQNKYNFQYIDYFRSNLFEIDDFFDVSHLNINGSTKFTNILNKLIK